MKAFVTSSRYEAAGSWLAADLTAGDVQVPMVNAWAFDDDGGICVIVGHTVAYTGVLWADEGDGVTFDTLLLAAGSPIGGTAEVTRVEVPGQAAMVAQVVTVASQTAYDAIVDPSLAADAALKASPLSGALVRCEWRGHGPGRRLWVAGLIGRPPSLSPAFWADGVVNAALSFPNMTTVPPVVGAAITAGVAGVSGGSGIGGVDGGLWGDVDGGEGVDGGIW